MDEKFTAQYTRWIRSEITTRLLEDAELTLAGHTAGIDDEKLTGAAKAYWMRKGGDLILAYLRTRPTVDDMKRIRDSGSLEPDYGADEILQRTMNP